MKNHSVLLTRTWRYFMALCFLFLSASFYSNADASAWISSPSSGVVGHDMSISGGNMPPSALLTIQATNENGELVLEVQVFTRSDGNFETEMVIEESGLITFSLQLENQQLQSVSSVISDV